MADQLSSDLASLRIDRNGDERDPNRKGPARYLVYAGAGLAFVAIAYFVLLPMVERKLFKTEVAVTEIALVSPAQSAIELTSTGYVVPQRVSQVAAKVPGRVTELKVRQGDRVAAGDVLMTLDPTDQDAAITAARSRVAAARANALTARANLAEAEQQAARERALFERGVSPEAVAQDLEKRVDSLKASVKAADAQVAAAQAEVRALEISRENYTVVAPIGGTIVSKPPEVGEMVGPAMGGIASQLGGIEIADFDSLAVETDVPEGRLHLVKLGGPCEIVLDAFPARRFRGEAMEIVPKVNRAKATVTVKVKFTDDPEGVLPEMSARVSFLSGTIDDTAIKEPPKLVVPGSAVVDRSGAKVVFVLDGGRVRMMPVELGEPFGTGFELKRGPSAGTRVIKDPPAELADGQKVKEKTDT